MNQFKPRRRRNPGGNFRHQRDAASAREFVGGGLAGTACPGEFMNGWSAHPADRIWRTAKQTCLRRSNFPSMPAVRLKTALSSLRPAVDTSLRHFFVVTLQSYRD